MTGPSPRIWGAVLLGLFLVLSAYTASRQTTPSSQAASATTETNLRPVIQVADSDADGLEDWKRELIKTDPIMLPENSSSSDYERPDTLTAQFGISLAENLIAAKSTQGLGRGDQEVINDVVANTLEEIQPKTYTFSDIIVVDTSSSTVENYLNTTGDILIETGGGMRQDRSEIFMQALETNNPDALTPLKSVKDTYQTIIDQYLNTPVPDNLATQHLAIINTYQALYSDTESMLHVYDDPLYTLIRIQVYGDNIVRLRQALTGLYVAMEDVPGTLKPGDSGLFFFALAPDAVKWHDF